MLPAGDRVWDWLWFGLLRLLWPFRGGFVFPFRRFAFGVGFFAPCGGFVYPYCRFSPGVGFGLSRLALILIARGGFVYFPFPAPRIGRPTQKLKKFAL